VRSRFFPSLSFPLSGKCVALRVVLSSRLPLPLHEFPRYVLTKYYGIIAFIFSFLFFYALVVFCLLVFGTQTYPPFPAGQSSFHFEDKARFI